MLDLLKKASLTQEEIVNLDKYLGDNIEAMILYLGNNEILRLINLFNDKLEESSFYKNLISHLEFLDLYAMFINEDDIDNYLKYYELEKELDYDKSYLGLYIANYYFNEGNKDLALNYYKEIFEENFSLSSPNYYDALVNYLDLLETKPKEKLIELIENSSISKDYSIDLVNTYLLLISNLNITDKGYLRYINKILPYARKLARKIQKENRIDYSLSDSDEERNLCELLCLKFEYYVEKKSYIRAFKIYKELTKEIALSGCLRYYTARDKYYRLMLDYLSNEYEDVKFLTENHGKNLRIIESFNTNNEMLNKEINLVNENEETYKFKVIHIYEDEITIVPFLPLIGEGGNIYTVLTEKEGIYYLEFTSKYLA